MASYRQGAFRSVLEQRVFEVVRDTLQWCIEFAAANAYPYPISGTVYHNVQTAEFHGRLTEVDSFADPQTREIDCLLELDQPKPIRVLTSVKDSGHRQTVEHLGDYESLLNLLRGSQSGWLYWATVVARKGFQTGCEQTAKRADIALVPPLTGDVAWLAVLTEEEVLERVSDAIKVFVLGEAWKCDVGFYQCGTIYNSIFVATREPSGVPGSTRIRIPDGTEVPMRDFLQDAMAKESNKFRIPLSRSRTYVPFFDPPFLQSVARDGSVVPNAVGSTIVSSGVGLRFFRVRTDTGRELIADAQRALYVVQRNEQGRKLVRVDQLKIGTQVLCVDDDGTGSRPECIVAIEQLQSTE